MICPYCNNQAEWVENKEVYGKNYGKSYMMWLCKPCDSYVGCHNNTRKSLGTLANKETRDWRKKAHKVFDPLWKSKRMTRQKAYGVLESHFRCVVHIGESDINTCKEIVELLKGDR